VAYVLRAIGDATGRELATWVSWISPIGWSQQVRPFAQERWFVLVLPVLFAAAAAAGAYLLSGRRDLGSGVLPDRAGPAVADPSLASPLALAWRLQRGTFWAWLGAVALIATLVGAIATHVGGIVDNPAAQDFITKLGGTKALTDAYLALELGMLGSIVSIFGMQAAMRPRSEEVSWRADLLLSTATGRVQWLASHVTIAVAGTCVVLLVGGLASGVAYAAQVGDPAEIGRVVVGAAVQIPAACVMVAIVVAAFGFAPGLTSATWALLVAFLLLGEFGTLFDVPRRIMDLSPFAHVPRVPGSTIEVAPLLGLIAAAVAVGGAGVVAFTRRDVG
jgi:ABC-2 type transport system permease protein